MEIIERYSRWIISHRLLIIIASLIFVGISSYGIKWTTVESDYEVFFDSENARLTAYRLQEDIYGRQDNVRIAVTVKEGTVFSREILSLLNELTEAAWQTPYSRRVDSLTNFAYVRSVGDEVFIDELFLELDHLSDDELNTRQTFALSDPAVIDNLVSPNAKTAGLFITVLPPKGDKAALTKVAEYVTELQDQYSGEKSPVVINLSGSVMISDAFFQASTKGTGKLILTMLIVSVVLVAVLIRRFSGAIVALGLIIMSVLSAFGIAAWIGYPVTAVTSSIPVIIMAIAIANMIHLVTTFYHRHTQNAPIENALAYAIKSNLKPIALTSLTTVIGFICLNASSVPPYRYMGSTMAIGVFYSFILCFTFLPACLSYTKTRRTLREDSSHDQTRWARFSRYCVINNRKASLFVGVICLVSLGFIGNNVINDSMVTYFDKGTKMRTQSEYVMEHLSFVYGVHLNIDSKESEGIGDPKFVKHVERLVEWSRSQPEVRTVISYTDTLKTLNRAMNQGDDAFYKLPETTQLSSQYLLLYELSLPYGLDLTNRISIDKSSARVTVGFYNLTNLEIRDFYDRMTSWLRANWPEHMYTEPTSPPLLFAFIWNDSVVDNVASMLMAVLLVSIVIGLAFRNPTLAFLSLIPNILPALIGFGLWGAINGKIDIASSIVLVVSFGIVVDDTIHIIDKYITGRKNLMLEPEEAAYFALSTTGMALFKTTFVLLISFSMLALSTFVLNSSMGILTAIMLVSALLFDFTVLIYLLVKMDSLIISDENEKPVVASV